MMKNSSNRKYFYIKWSKFFELLVKDVNEFNRIYLSLFLVLFIFFCALISFFVTNSFAWFSYIESSNENINVIACIDSFIPSESRNDANIPVLSENMIPVYYDECDEVWKKADPMNEHYIYRWYNYDKKIWANSVTVSSETRDVYKSAPLGTKIDMNDILTMQVWIPRYKYKVWNYNLNGTVASTPQEIEITFEEDLVSTGEIECTDTISGVDGSASEICKLKINNTNCTNELCNGKTYTHPAFTFGDKELEGIWVGKFELSSDIECTVTTREAVGNGCNLTNIKPLIKPDSLIWRGAMVGTYQHNIMMMNDVNNIYGFSSTDDTHVIKNIDWGAVAFLSHSKYGKNGEVQLNAYKNYQTGCGPKELGNIVNTSACNAYNTTLGQSASTTGNIYGIYDMSGGAYEYVMGNMVSPDGVTMMSGYLQTDISTQHSGYTGILFLYNSISYNKYVGTYEYPNNKYLDKYSYGKTVQVNRSKLGDALREVFDGTNLWYSDGSHIVVGEYAWFSRGGYQGSIAATGIFGSHYTFGNANTTAYYSSRLVVTQ